MRNTPCSWHSHIGGTLVWLGNSWDGVFRRKVVMGWLFVEIRQFRHIGEGLDFYAVTILGKFHVLILNVHKLLLCL